MREIYCPESFPAPPSNREDISSLAALERAMNEGKILKSNVLFCDSSMRLHIDLGGIRGIIERDETVFCRGTEAIKDIAVISRVGKQVAFKVIGFTTERGETVALLSRRAAQKECNEKYVSSLRVMGVGTGYLRISSSAYEGIYADYPFLADFSSEPIKKEILSGEYKIEREVDIYMMIDTKCVYKVGEGTLTHTKDGFKLVGCDGQLEYTQAPELSYSLYSDFYWYEIGDVISIGTPKVLYYCIPKTKRDIVAKARIAAEEIYKLLKK